MLKVCAVYSTPNGPRANIVLTLIAVWSYVGFVGIIWFTWLQVTLFDIRFSRDSIFERTCKVVQLSAMIGFASAGSRFSSQIKDENVWAFKSLSMLLFGSRFMLALQYAINLWFIHEKLRSAVRGMFGIIGVHVLTGISYLIVSPNLRRGQHNRLTQTDVLDVQAERAPYLDDLVWSLYV